MRAVSRKSWGLPAVNAGPHAGVRLDTVLDFAIELAARGDTVVVVLDPSYYDCDSMRWTRGGCGMHLRWISRDLAHCLSGNGCTSPLGIQPRPWRPTGVCASSGDVLRAADAALKAKNARMLFAHAPYLVEAPHDAGWEKAPERFLAEMARLDLEVVDHREESLVPRAMFFDTWLHLNETGRADHAARLIANLRKAHVAPVPPNESAATR